MAEKQIRHKVKSKKNVKKSFYEVPTSLTATKIYLYSSSAEELNNKTAVLDLTKSLRGKSLLLKIRIKNTDGKLQGVPESASLAQSYIKRVMRRGSDYVEDSFKAECRDSIAVVKPLMITRRRVSKATLKALRNAARKNIESYIKTRNAEEVISDIITNKLQKQLIPKLKKIYPLALCEIRVFEIEKMLDKKPSKKDEEVSSEEEQ